MNEFVRDGQPVREGHIAFGGSQTWYRIVGEAEAPAKLPVLCLHGGPGATWHHMEPYQQLAEGRRAVFYDQIGCGNSPVTTPHDPSMFTFDLFVREVDAVREALDLPRVVVFGHSWGGMLAMLYALEHPEGLEGLVIQSSPASVPLWLTELDRIRAELPSEVEATLRRHEESGTTDSAEYEEAMMVFYDRHVCRVEWPGFVRRTFDGLLANPEVYFTLNGPSEFHVIGPLKDYDVSGRLGEIDVPTLVISGRHDEVTPATVEQVHHGIEGSEWLLLEDASHMAQAEQPEVLLSAVRTFLARVEAAAG
jgi:proline-specific peptidase